MEVGGIEVTRESLACNFLIVKLLVLVVYDATAILLDEVALVVPEVLSVLNQLMCIIY
jgi:hypothetical protein